jgi:dihydroorotate dehydrogenase electron transfer subunit
MINNILARSFPVSSCNEVSENTFLLKITAPEISSVCRPGQFVNILVAEYGKGPLLRRPFSISGVDGAEIEILFHSVGRGTIMMSEKKAGDMLDILGPLGTSYTTGGDFERAVILAGGIGIAPFPFLNSELKKSGKQVGIFAGFRNSAQIYTGNLPDVQISTEDGSKGFKGNVLQMYSALESMDRDKIKIFACGPNPMLKAVAEMAVKNGIRCEVSLEGQMACGVGICQGCPVPNSDDDSGYSLVCKEGPVFSADKIKIL